MVKGRGCCVFSNSRLNRDNAVRLACACSLLVISAFALAPQRAVADQSGVSFWLPGMFGSLAAVPVQPGLSAAMIYYHTTVSAGGDVSAAREVQIGGSGVTVKANLNANLNANADLALLVSVRRVLESYESVVIQGWWPDSRRVTNVDEQEPRTLRPQ
jgi:hypothetical protein